MSSVEVTPINFSANQKKFTLTAHRGSQIETAPPLSSGEQAYTVYVENTLDAFVRAAQLGADGIELDIIGTIPEALKDQNNSPTEPVESSPKMAVHHDDILGRVFRLSEAGGELVKALPFSKLKETVFNLDGLKGSIEPRLRDAQSGSVNYVVTEDTRIPSLEEVFDKVFAIKPDMHFYVEIKTTQDTPYPADTNNVEDHLVKLIQDRNLYDNVTVISFNPWSLAKIRQLDPAIKTGLDMVAAEYLPHSGIESLMNWAKEIVGVEAVLPPYQEVTEAFVKAAKAVGLKILPWVWPQTVKEELAYGNKLRDLGVDGLITNSLDMMKKHLEG